MSTTDVIWKDLLNVRRSKGIWVAVSAYAVFAGLFLIIQRDQLRFYEGPQEGTVTLVSQVASLGTALVPIVAFVVAYLAIAGERETGSAKLELGLSNTRLAIVVGKFISRSLVVALSIVIAYAVVVVCLFALYPIFPGTTILVLLGVMTLYSVVYTAIAIGISASVASKARAAAAGFGVYFFLNVVLLVTTLGDILQRILVGGFGMNETPALYELASQLVPSQSALQAIQRLTGRSVTGSELPSEIPVYLRLEFALLILCLWIVVPLVIGYYRFSRADIS